MVMAISSGDMLIFHGYVKNKTFIFILKECDLVALRCLLKYLAEINIKPLLIDPETWVDRVDKSKHIVSKVLDQRLHQLDLEDEIVTECR